MIKKVSICVLALALIFGANAFADQDNAMTNADFAYMLLGAIGAQLPQGIEDLNEAEAFEVMTNVLAANGIDTLAGADPAEPVSYGEMADVLYAVLGGGDLQGQDAKIDYLVSRGYMAKKNADEVVVLADAGDIMNNPDFAGLIAEAYSEPETGEDAASRAAGLVGIPGSTPEESASRI